MKEKLERIKAHLKENKTAYMIGGGIGLAVGVVATVILTREGSTSSAIATGWKTKAVNVSANTTIIGNGHPGKVILDTDTGRVFKSQKEASDVLEVSARKIAEHLKGERDHAGGHTLVDLGRAA